MNSRELVTVDAQLEQDIREEYDELLLISGSSTRNGHFHIPDIGNEPLCGRTVKKREKAQWQLKSTKVYPPGHKEICSYCATKWVRNNV